MSAGYARTQILHDVSLRVDPGEAVAILGRNGVGKTTLVKAVAGLIPIWAGRLLIDGVDLTHAPAYQRVVSRVGYVGQDQNIFPTLGVRENLMVSAVTGTRRQRAEAADRLLEEEFPALINKANQRASTLSGGERRLLALARVLMGGPNLLLLDEPTSGLQPTLVENFQRNLIDLKSRKNLTLVLVEQRLDVAAHLASRAYLMVKGSLVKQMPTNRLLEDVDAQQRYLGV